MTRYLVTIHRPKDYDPAAAEDEAMRREISALNDDMVAAGVRVFVGGLHGLDRAVSLEAGPDGAIRTTPGPYLKGDAQGGGLWVLETVTLDEALAWGRKAAIACRAAVEVRPFH